MTVESTVIVCGLFKQKQLKIKYRIAAIRYFYYDARMLIKFTSNDPIFEQAIQLLKLKYRTGATSKAVRRAIYEFYEIEQENQILSVMVESLEDEVFRLRQLLDIQRSTRTRAIVRNLR